MHMRGMKEGVVQLVLGRKVLLLNKITSFGWSGLVIAFSTVQSQAISAKQQNRIYTVKMEKEKKKVAAITKLGGSGSTPRIWHFHFAVRREVWPPTRAVWPAAVLPGDCVTLRWRTMYGRRVQNSLLWVWWESLPGKVLTCIVTALLFNLITGMRANT